MEWILPRTIAYALFDLHLILYERRCSEKYFQGVSRFRAVYLYREITINKTILSEFKKINLVSFVIQCISFSRVSCSLLAEYYSYSAQRTHPYKDRSDSVRVEDTTQAYFDQLANSWN